MGDQLAGYCNPPGENEAVLDQTRGRDERWSDSGYILKAEPTKFSGGVNMVFKRKRGVKDDTKVSA